MDTQQSTKTPNETHLECPLTLTTAEYAQLALYEAEMLNPPYNLSRERLKEAMQVIEHGLIVPCDTQGEVWEVTGNENKKYLVDTMGCACPAMTKGKRTKHGCYHAVAATLMRRVWQARQQISECTDTPQTHEDRLYATQETAMSNHESPPQNASTAPSDANKRDIQLVDEATLKHQKAEIVRLLATWGCHPKTREEYEKALDWLTGLPLEPAHFATIITTLQRLLDARQASLSLMHSFGVALHGTTLHHAGAVMHEAPFSATVSVEDTRGYRLLVTVRRQDEQEGLVAMEAMLGWCEEHGLVPQKRFSSMQGQGGQRNAHPAESTGSPGASAAPVCKWHSTMKPSKFKDGEWICTGKMADGTYCKEKTLAPTPPRAA